MVPSITFAFMAASVVLSVGAPIALFFIVRKKYGKGVLPVLLGAAGFILFAMVLEQILHFAVLEASPQLIERPFWYIFYGSMAAGVFEESARFASFHILKKRRTGFGTALQYGIGHGGAEAIILGGISMISIVVLIAMANNFGAQAPEVLGAAAMQQVQAVAEAPPAVMLVSGIERLLAIGVHVSLSVAVYYAVYQPRKVWLYPLAVVLHALVNVPAGLYQVGVLTNLWLVEGTVAFAMAALIAFAALLHRRLKTEA